MEDQPRGGDLRALKALVGVMGVLIVVGTAVVIGVVIHRIYAKPAQPSITAVLPGEPAAAAAAPDNAPGRHVAGIAAAGGDLAVWQTGPGGDRILLLDPRTGAVTTVALPK